MLALGCALPGTAQAASLYSGDGPRPGPDVLYAKPVDAPQLQNAPRSGWSAKPILVSGATAYRNGEFLYQDFLYDDHGARGVPDLPADGQRQAISLFSLVRAVSRAPKSSSGPP